LLVRRDRRSRNGAIALVLVLALVDPVLAAILNKRARLREGPSRHATLVDWIESATTVDILGERSGWYQVLLSDGRRGYIWGEHLDGLDPAPTDVAPGESGARSLRDDLRELREELARLSTDETLARRADVEALATRVDELTQTQQELGALIESSSPSVATPMDGTAVAAGVFLAVGAILGWIASRLGLGRRDRRSRLRL
jgi:hypothetical protein